MLFMGIDAGTQGVRAVIVSEEGKTVAEHSVAYKRLNVAETKDWYEQAPGDWKSATWEAVAACTAALKAAGGSGECITALSVDATSGTLVLLDKDGNSLANAMMYNDLRSSGESEKIAKICPELEKRLGYRFTTAFSLPRMRWVMEERPDLYKRTAMFAHQTDYIIGCLCGETGVSDYANGVKSGYDAEKLCWPGEIWERLGLDRKKLPRVVEPGSAIGHILPDVAKELGLSEKTVVTAGATDAYASVLASGGIHTGSRVSVLGTTLVCKAITKERITDPSGAGYPYRMPTGSWLVGGASNVGGRWVTEAANGRSLRELDQAAELLLPTGIRCYPLYGKGERFPFSDPEATAYFSQKPQGDCLYAALMEGVGFSERLIYDKLEEQGCRFGAEVWAAGGGSKSAVWLQIRADILRCRLLVPHNKTAALGAAMLAASGYLGGLEKAVDAMKGEARSIYPQAERQKVYQELYCKFREDCQKRYGI